MKTEKFSSRTESRKNYDAAQAVMVRLIREGKDCIQSREFAAAWQICENEKNKNFGMPPKN